MLLGEVLGSLCPPGPPRFAKEMQNPVRGSPRASPFGSQNLIFFQFIMFFQGCFRMCFFHCFLTDYYLILHPPDGQIWCVYNGLLTFLLLRKSHDFHDFWPPKMRPQSQKRELFDLLEAWYFMFVHYMYFSKTILFLKENATFEDSAVHTVFREYQEFTCFL